MQKRRIGLPLSIGTVNKLFGQIKFSTKNPASTMFLSQQGNVSYLKGRAEEALFEGDYALCAQLCVLLLATGLILKKQDDRG